MNQTDLATVVATRLEDMAAQVERLYANGYHAEAAVLRAEGLHLAEAYDNEEDFFVIGDFTAI